MIKIDTYSNKGKKLEAFSLPKELEAKENKALLSQAIHVYRDRLHNKPAYTQTRSDVNRTKAKAYKQKGTGNARHGAKSAPIFVGGGEAHGAKGVKRILTLPVKMKKLARNLALNMKVNEKKVVGVVNLKEIKKTAEASKLIKNLRSENQKITVVLKGGTDVTRKVMRNLERIVVLNYEDLNAYNIYFGGILVFDLEIFEKEKKVKKVQK